MKDFLIVFSVAISFTMYQYTVIQVYKKEHEHFGRIQ